MNSVKTYRLAIRLSHQEDGLWRAELPGLQGAFVDAVTVAEAMSDIQGVAAMYLDYYSEVGLPLPTSIKPVDPENFEARLLLALDEHEVMRSSKRIHACAKSA
jgi:predicted RNase H-like HicB family nuclease